MTISSTTRVAGPFLGNGTASNFSFAFKVFTATDLDVIRLASSTGVETTLVLNSDYSVTLNGDQNSNPGGSVTLLAGALASGFTLTITSDIANLQPTDLTNQGGFYPEVITDSLDRATIQIQQISDIGDRTLKIPISDGTGLNMELPTAAARANAFLSFDANGEPTVVAAGSSGAPTTITRQVFSGTGSQTVFTLASDPGALGNSAQVYIGGVYQQRSTYTIAGTTLTFSAAPVAGPGNIEFVNFLTSSIGATSADLVTYTPAGSGAVARSAASKFGDVVSVKDFGAVGDGVADDTNAIQAAINASTSVYVPNGTYMCANIQMRNNLHLYGQSYAAVLKLLPNALLASHNGSLPDPFGFYPGNVIGSTLNYNGGIWNDGGVRAKNPNNSTYIYENVLIENLTIDGNKANNQIGDLGANRSVMGACIAIMQCKNVTVRSCQLLNARLDGICIGYSEHGGSDYCLLESNYFAGNQRTNIAAVTGKYNLISCNVGENTTGGTGVNVGAAVDIEPNLVNEVNYRHTVVGNRFQGAFGIVCLNSAIMHDIVASGNVWGGQLFLDGGGKTQGVVIDGDTFIANQSSQDWLVRRGPNVSPTGVRPTIISNCSVSGFRYVVSSALVPGAVENIVVQGSSIKTESFGTLNRGYKVMFKDNSFLFAGNSDTHSAILSNTLGGIVPNQGNVEFVGNQFYGTSNATFMTIARDSSWAVGDADFVIYDNDFHVTGQSNMFENMTSATIASNRFTAWKPIKISGIDKFRFIDNEVTASSAENLFSNQTALFTQVEISENEFRNVNVNAIRPLDCAFANNKLFNGNIQISYSFTSSVVGRNHVCFNRLTSTAALSNPFIVITGSSFNTGDFAGNDQYKYNTYVGYGSGASIAAGMVGVYDGTFD